ncbi:DUF933 domain-containing protein [Candidatus Shikimatogenerans bostrichidophilus]|uniref:DUF933 domain-containing protein n=1 Tax=Candidatus Shikimatogenerans bostrichidophilus TaxID=2943807 RepID=UPI002966D0E5
MECGIIGLPNVGKSSLFYLLSNIKVIIKNYPFSTIKPNKTIINVYDDRLIKISKIFNFNIKQYNYIKLIDIAGIIKNSYKGKGLGNMFLSYIRNTKILINILRLFYNNKIININNIIDPIYERKIILNELIMKDIEIIEKNIKIKKNNINKLKLNKILKIFKNKNINDIKKICNDEKKIIKQFNFLCLKPIFYICNIDKNTKNDEILFIKEYFNKNKENVLFLNIKYIINNKNKSKKKIYKLINNIYYKLNYNTFFTIDNKKKIICSWKIKKNSYAYKASERIHSTFSKRIIKVEVIKSKKLINNKIINYKKYLSIKNKNYIVKDGDILFFKLNK